MALVAIVDFFFLFPPWMKDKEVFLFLSLSVGRSLSRSFGLVRNARLKKPKPESDRGTDVEDRFRPSFARAFAVRVSSELRRSVALSLKRTK